MAIEITYSGSVINVRSPNEIVTASEHVRSVEIAYSGSVINVRSPNEIVMAYEHARSVEIKSGILVEGFPAYSGEYDVTPLPRDDIVLPTANRSMSDDVTVRRIPYYETSNPSGGYTAIIG